MGAYVRVHGISACAIRYAVRVLSTQKKNGQRACFHGAAESVRVGVLH